MLSFMSEEDAIAVIEKNMDKIEAKMASGTNASSSQANAGNIGSGQPCDGSCEGDNCCNCCVC